jgi:glycosyltransferase involved in cell wall biosynthesis
MRIMQVNSSWGWSGGQSQVLELSTGLAARGHAVVVVGNPESELVRRAGLRGLETREVYMKKEYNLGAVFALRRLMKDLSIDVVHVHKPVPFSLGSPAASWAKVPVFVVSRRVSFPIGRNPFSAFKWRHLRIDAVVAVSRQIRDGLVEFGFPPEKVEVIYSGTDPQVFHPGYSGARIREEFGLSEDTRVVTKLANYFEWKGYRVFLEAAAELVKEFPYIAFLCVGHRNDFFPEMREIAARLGIEDHVVFTGFRNDIPEIVAASDVTVNCAIRGEGLAGVLRESLAMEVPVVASDAGGNGELVVDGVTGRLVPKGDVQATAKAIADVLNNPEDASIMARRGRDRVMNEFTLEAMVEKTEACYQRLYTRRTGGRG